MRGLPRAFTLLRATGISITTGLQVPLLGLAGTPLAEGRPGAAPSLERHLELPSLEIGGLEVEKRRDVAQD